MDDPQQGRGTALAAATLALTAFLLLCAYPATGLAAWLGGKPQDVQARPWVGLKLWQAAAKSLSSEMDWQGARSWVQDQIETIASVDNQTGWHGSVDPLRPRVVINARRRLLQSRRGRVAASNAATGSGRAEPSAGPTAAHAQQPEPPSSRRGDAAAGGNPRGSAGATARAMPTKPTALLAVPTANVWNKTQLMLACLAMIKDKFELLIVDELSTDETVPKLREMGINVIQPPDILGVTYNWNMAYRYWKNSSHEYLFISNNDVLVPDGVMTSLMHAMRDGGPGCNLVLPLSTAHGKGYRKQESVEAVFDLPPRASAWVNQIHNFGRLQAVLESVPASRDTLILDTRDVHNSSYSGFFFGVRRDIDVAAFDPGNGFLFDPALRILGQEIDLWERMVVHNLRLCLDAGSFVYHFKGSTISPVMTTDRDNFRAPGR